jgi:antitoxin ParD1/3/4
MNVSLTPELERVVNEKVESGMYQMASEVVREALRLLKERDEARAHLRADVQGGLDQVARGEGRSYDRATGRQVAERIKSKGRAARARKP